MRGPEGFGGGCYVRVLTVCFVIAEEDFTTNQRGDWTSQDVELPKSDQPVHNPVAVTDPAIRGARCASML